MPALSGILLGISYLPGPLLLLNLTAFIPMLIWLEAQPAARPFDRLKAGFVFGLVAHLIAMHWQYSMLTYSWLAVLLYIGMATLLALRIGLTVALAGWLRRQTGLSWGLLLPITWLPVEWLQTWGDLRLTGEHLAHTVAGYPFLVQFADATGPYGVGALLLATNGLGFEIINGLPRAAGRRAAVALGSILAAVLVYDGWAWTRSVPEGETIRVALIQPNIPLDVKHDRDTRPDQWRTLVELSTRAAPAKPELIVWPESARPAPLYHRLDRPETYAMPEVQSLARELGAAFLVGVEYARLRSGEDHDWYNAAVAVDASGRMLEDWGAKVYLVPFVESVPFRKLLGPLVEGRGGEWQWVSGGFTAGPRSALIEVAGARIGVLVCYEQLFADLARDLRNAGAELQLVITNDAWFGRSLFQQYQANVLRLRAIENRTAFVRVANTGISGFVDSRGRYHQRTGLFEQAVEVRDVPRSAERTIYDRTGDLVAWLAVAGLGAAIFAAWRATPVRLR